MINSNGPVRAQCTDNGQPGHQLIDGDFTQVWGLYQSINQYLSASCHTALGHKLAQSSTIHKQATYSQKRLLIHKKEKTVDLDNVSFTYIVYNSVYNSVKGSQGIGSSVRHYVPKRAFHIVWITAAVLWLWQARHRILAVDLHQNWRNDHDIVSIMPHDVQSRLGTWSSNGPHPPPLHYHTLYILFALFLIHAICLSLFETVQYLPSALSRPSSRLSSLHLHN